jgi:hypothetical protein
MSEQRIAQRVVERARKPEQASSPPSTKEILVDGRYARLLAEDLGVKETTARTAFIGEPQKRALGVVAWAFKHAADDPQKRAKMILLWAKRRGAGAFRQDDDAEKELARRIAEYWRQHPEQLARTLREATNGARS